VTFALWLPCIVHIAANLEVWWLRRRSAAPPENPCIPEHP
jgi:hypothetical protein